MPAWRRLSITTNSVANSVVLGAWGVGNIMEEALKGQNATRVHDERPGGASMPRAEFLTILRSKGEPSVCTDIIITRPLAEKREKPVPSRSKSWPLMAIERTASLLSSREREREAKQGSSVVVPKM